MSNWQVGSAQVVITPPLGINLAGYPLDRPALGVRDDLVAGALVFACGERRGVLVTCDLIALDTALADSVRRQIAARLRTDPACVILAASHTHTGPVTADLFQTVPDREWVPVLERQLVGVAELAAARLRPAELRVGSGEAGDICHNRRIVMQNGQAALVMHPEFRRELVVGPEGPTDPSVGVLAITSGGTDLQAVAVNFGSHPDNVTGTLLSADFPGDMARAIRAVYGPDVAVCFTMGAGGDTVPFDPLDEREVASRKVVRFQDLLGSEKARRYGTVLAAEVMKTLEQGRKEAPVSGSIEAASCSVAVPVRAVTPEQAAEARAVAGEPDRWEADRNAAAEVLRVEAMAGESIRLELTAMAVGPLALVAVPGELFAELGLAIKAASPFRFTWVVTLANGYHGYIPTRRAFAHGGYETRPARSSMLAEDAGEQIVAAAVALLRSLNEGGNVLC